MCGIVGYIGSKRAYPILIKGLKRLEYRGYDSAGIALLNGDLTVYKRKGKVAELESIEAAEKNTATIGMGHTRWATHGIPNEINAHPHQSGNERIALVHNGIIENYAEIKEALLAKGHQFLGQTDTEVLVHFIEDIQTTQKVTLAEAVRRALLEAKGNYAIVVLSKDEDKTVITARKGSPLVIGIGENEYFIASDATPIVEYTKSVVYLEDEEMGIIENNTLTIKTIHNEDREVKPQEVALNVEALEKGGYEHFMLKEIYDQPKSIANSMRGRIQDGKIVLEEIVPHLDRIMAAQRIIFVACGTSWHSALIAGQLFEDIVRIPTKVEYASEFRYKNPVINKNDVLITISQSGETADTLAAIELAQSAGAFVIGICNVVGSSIARTAHACVYTHAGPEIGVASTKAFTAQTMVLSLLALFLGQEKGTMTERTIDVITKELDQIPEKITEVLAAAPIMKEIAEKYKNYEHAMYLGRNYNFPVALEGALKLKEISYIHAEGYPAAEMKHGPIALIDSNMPVVCIATQGALYEKTVSNIQEVKARGGKILAIINKEDEVVRALVEDVIEVPAVSECLSPLINSIPLQILSYYIATARGCNVDQPRNLAKSVTVE